MSFRRQYLALAGVLVATGCYRAVGIESTQLTNGQISIAAEENWRFNRPCIDQVRMYRLAEGQRAEVWNIALRDGDRCVGAFIYPETPTGYDVIVAPTALHAGDDLEVTMSGAGINALTHFAKQ